MSFGPAKAPKKAFIFYFDAFESESGSIPKNNGLNPWSFQFLGYPRLGPRAKLPPPPKTGGWIRQWVCGTESKHRTVRNASVRSSEHLALRRAPIGHKGA